MKSNPPVQPLFAWNGKMTWKQPCMIQQLGLLHQTQFLLHSKTHLTNLVFRKSISNLMIEWNAEEREPVLQVTEISYHHIYKKLVWKLLMKVSLHGMQLLECHQTWLDPWEGHTHCSLMGYKLLYIVHSVKKNPQFSKTKLKFRLPWVVRHCSCVKTQHTSSMSSIAKNEAGSWNASLNLDPALKIRVHQMKYCATYLPIALHTYNNRSVPWPWKTKDIFFCIPFLQWWNSS